jgi:hypothetical protein
MTEAVSRFIIFEMVAVDGIGLRGKAIPPEPGIKRIRGRRFFGAGLFLKCGFHNITQVLHM